MLRINPEKQEVSGIVKSLPRQCKPSLTDNQGPGLQGKENYNMVLPSFVSGSIVVLPGAIIGQIMRVTGR